MADERPPDLTAEETAKHLSPAPAVEEVPPPDLPREETLKVAAHEEVPPDLNPQDTERAMLDHRMSGAKMPALQAGLGKDGFGGGDTFNTMAAAGEFYDKEKGWLENAFYTMSLGEQFVARQAVGVLENLSMMSTDDARDIISRDQVHGSDIVNYYWKDNMAETYVGKTGRFVTGMAADILLDPLSYVGVGALTQSAKTATVGGKVISGMGELSKAERAYYKTLEVVEKVVGTDGNWLSKLDDAEDVAKENALLIANARDGLLGFSELEQKLGVSPETRKTLVEQIRIGRTEKSWAEEWHEGSRGLTYGARIPFTNMGFEADIPGPFSKLAALPLGALDGTFGIAKSAIRESGWGDAAFNLLANVGTKTGKFGFDEQQNIRLGAESVMKENMGVYREKARVMFQDKKKTLGDQFPQLWDDVTNELDNGLHSQEEAIKLADAYELKHGTRPDEEFVKNLYTANPEDAARAERLAAHPEALEYIEESRKMMNDMAAKYKARDLPFDELNPFGKGWARQYMKRVVSNEYLDKMREIFNAKNILREEGLAKQVEGAVAPTPWFDKMQDKILGKAQQSTGMDLLDEAFKDNPSLMGKVDQSAKGRSFRGTLAEGNADTLEKHGVKMYVDDPIELMTRRYEEMNKVIQDHDLMLAASEYAYKGSDPGKGYKLFNIDDYRRLSIDESDQFKASWDAFVPKFYKETETYLDRAKFPKAGAITTEARTAASGVELVAEKRPATQIYLPEDVAARLDFSLNGWNMDKPLAKFLSAADFYTNVWRNNALFGASYIGLNAFSNALTYLSLNDKGGITSLAKATAMILPSGKNLAVHAPRMTPEEIRAIKTAFGATEETLAKEVTEKGVPYLTGHEIYKMAREDNLLGSTYSSGIEFSKLSEHVASNREARKGLIERTVENVTGKEGVDGKTIADYAYLWKLSRATAQHMDDIPKLGIYMSYLEKGFSRKAASDQAEKLMYNFNNMSKVQATIAKVIPFSSFPMKTAEMVQETFKSGHWASLTIPQKVQAAFEGAFVQDHETREALDANLPGYKGILDPIHGELMPGMRELLIDIPWTYGTMDSLLHPEKANHPVAQLLALAGSWNQSDADPEQWAENAVERERMMASNLDLIVPSYFREAATLAEINGSMNFGGYFKDRYMATMPTQKQWERGESERDTLDKGTIYQKFQNQSDFGAAMDKKYGEDWLYNLAFYNRVDADENVIAAQESGARGEYIRRKMRQFTGGLVSMTKLDSNFFMNTFAIKRQEDILQRKLKAEIVQSGALMDTERINEPAFLEKLAETRPMAKELLALGLKKKTLSEYYEFWMSAEHKLPKGLNLADIIFGGPEKDLDYAEKPDPDEHSNLFKKKTQKAISNEDADEKIEDIQSEVTL